ncbi:MAG TPA: tryptophan synthase subunit alpha [Geobacterales bacterium]|nr:tryptophan synthase subunit alpha [Geobacterales bacterium]
MNRIDALFATLRQQNDRALVTFITAGDPNLAETESLIPLLSKAGADIIELGVPFSDPMADGPTIQRASERALASGTTLADILAMVKRVRLACQVPLVLMGYYNPLFVYGLERFALDAAAAGVDGVLIVDLPPDEAAQCKALLDRHGIHLIFLLAPTSNAQRMEKVLAVASGFVYYVSVTGVTGARDRLPLSVADQVSRIRSRTELPVVVGFGISTPQQAADAAAGTDGVVVGSALVRIFEDATGELLRQKLTDLVSALKSSINSKR